MRYDVPGEAIYHERLCTAVAGDGGAVRSTVLTPDGDHYREDLHMDSPDLRDVAPPRVRGERVGGIPEARCYRFRAGVAAGRLAALSEAGRALLGDAEVVVEDVAAIPLPEEDAAGVANDAGGRTWRPSKTAAALSSETKFDLRPATSYVGTARW